MNTDWSDASKSVTILDLPNEILIEIFKHVRGYNWYGSWSLCCMTSLGLCSSRLYHILKIVHPYQICSRSGSGITDANGRFWPYALQSYISDFLGSDYRPRVYDPRFSRPWQGNDIPFLRRSLYGDGYGDEEKALNDRFFEWKILQRRFEMVLPSPFGMGEFWYEVAFEIVSRIAELSYRRKYGRPCWQGNGGYNSMVTEKLGYTNSFRYMNFRYEVKYDYFREGASMMGL